MVVQLVEFYEIPLYLWHTSFMNIWDCSKKLLLTKFSQLNSVPWRSYTPKGVSLMPRNWWTLKLKTSEFFIDFRLTF